MWEACEVERDKAGSSFLDLDLDLKSDLKNPPDFFLCSGSDSDFVLRRTWLLSGNSAVAVLCCTMGLRGCCDKGCVVSTFFSVAGGGVEAADCLGASSTSGMSCSSGSLPFRKKSISTLENPLCESLLFDIIWRQDKQRIRGHFGTSENSSSSN